MTKMEYLSEKLYKKTNTNEKMIYPDNDKEKFENATHCHICDEALPDGSTKTDHIGKWRDGWT